MARDMRVANRSLFLHLERYCARRQDPVQSPGEIRYVYGDATAQDFLRNLRVETTVQFGNRRALTHLTHASDHFVGLVGFEFETELPSLAPQAMNPGIGVCLLAELGPQPVAPTSQIRNVVEVARHGDPGYVGHDFTVVEALFPRLQVAQSPQALDRDSAWRLFLMLCAEECQRGESWIEDSLADAIVALTDLDIPSLPYPALCRSMFDLDPRTLYMALYRCLEATYAYESCRKLVSRLSLGSKWYDLAVALDDEVGWHPQEAASLNLVLQYALDRDLQEICDCLGVVAGSEVQVSAGRAIYKLRNRIVHYRPGHDDVEVEAYDWNRLCIALVEIVFSVFSRAFA